MNQPLRFDTIKSSGTCDTGNSSTILSESPSRGVQWAYQLDADPIIIGFFISALSKTSEDSAAYKYFGIEIQISNGGEGSTKHLYASTSKDREQWIRALKSATHTKAFQSEFDIQLCIVYIMT